MPQILISDTTTGTMHKVTEINTRRLVMQTEKIKPKVYHTIRSRGPAAKQTPLFIQEPEKATPQILNVDPVTG